MNTDQQRLALWVKFSADNILKYFSYFSQKTESDISYNCLHWRQFAWNVKKTVFWENKKIS